MVRVRIQTNMGRVRNRDAKAVQETGRRAWRLQGQALPPCRRSPADDRPPAASFDFLYESGDQSLASGMTRVRTARSERSNGRCPTCLETASERPQHMRP